MRSEGGTRKGDDSISLEAKTMIQFNLMKARDTAARVKNERLGQDKWQQRGINKKMYAIQLTLLVHESFWTRT